MNFMTILITPQRLLYKIIRFIIFYFIKLLKLLNYLLLNHQSDIWFYKNNYSEYLYWF